MKKPKPTSENGAKLVAEWKLKSSAVKSTSMKPPTLRKLVDSCDQTGRLKTGIRMRILPSMTLLRTAKMRQWFYKKKNVTLFGEVLAAALVYSLIPKKEITLTAQ